MTLLIRRGGVNIGSNIYFGTNVTVLKGVTIGDNCIIGAGSIVSRSIPANSVATGIPCRVVCTLDEYYEKRKKRALSEAVEYVNAIKDRFGRNPFPQEMREEFIYFVNKTNVSYYESLGIPIRFQLRESYEDFINNNQSLFSDFESFIQFCENQESTKDKCDKYL